MIKPANALVLLLLKSDRIYTPLHDY